MGAFSNAMVQIMKQLLWVSFFCCLLIVPVSAAEQIRVGVYDNPPKVFTTPEGFSSGLYPRLLNTIAQERKWSVEYVHGTWQQCLDRLEAGEIDLLVDIAKTKEREKRFDFTTEPVLTNWGVVYTRKKFPFTSFQDMRNKSIAVVKGSVHTDGPQGIRSLMKLFDIPCSFVEVDSYRHALMLLDAAQVDGCVVNRLFGALYADDYDVASTPIMFNPSRLFFAGQKNTDTSRRILPQIDKSLKRLKEDPDSVYHKDMAYYLSGGRQKWEKIVNRHLNDLSLSEKQIAWLKKHPVVRIGVDPGFAPFEYLSEDGKYEGIAADYFKLLSQKTGLKFELVKFDSWQQTIQAAENREIDILPCIGSAKERERFLLFTDSYIQFSRVIITAIDLQIDKQSGIGAIKNLKVGVQKNSSHHEFLKDNSSCSPVLYETFLQAVLSLSKGEIDAVIGNLAVATHLMKKLSITNLKLAAYAQPKPQFLFAGVRKDWPQLRSILNQALKSITYKEKNNILSKWLPVPADAAGDIGLSTEEREWLLMNPRIRVAWDRGWAPIEFVDSKGSPKGIAMDHLFAIEKMLGVEFDMGSDIGWQASLKKVEKREIDMLSCVSITPERLKYLNFTDDYLSVPVVIFGTDNSLYVRELSELKDKKVAVVKGYATDDWVTRDYPGFNLVKPSSVKEAFTLLKQKKIDAFVGNVLPGNYYLSQLQDHKIKIIGETQYKHKLRMAVRNDWFYFKIILQKALNALPDAEKNYFYRKWASVKYEKGFNYSLFNKIMLVILSVVVVIILWNRYMAAEIKRRKKVEEKLHQSQSELRTRNAELKEMEVLKDNLAHMLVHDMRSPLMGIGVALNLLNNRVKKLPTEADAQKHIMTAANGIGTLNRMVQSFLDVFKLESKELVLACKKLDLYDVAAMTIKEMEMPAMMYSQRLQLSGTSSVGKFDPEIIRRVLTNLIENALKANSKGGTVEICTMDDNNRLIAEVKDTGPGIPLEMQENIFDKFVSSEIGEKKGVPSYGLGLAFCKLAVEAHNGSVEINSDGENGAIFRIIIPKVNKESNQCREK